MNIKILQAENSIENVDRSVISALYNAHINGDISLEVDNNNQKVGLVGSITAPAGYAILVSTLNSAYPKFHVTVNSEYISFEDANVELILLNIGLGDGVGITVLAANNAAFTNSTFKNNTTITSFNEFPYFTRANTNPPVELFRGCTNLLEIDLSETSVISNNEFYESGITEINAPSLSSIGSNSFSYCTSLTTIASLGNITSIPDRAFYESYNILSVNLSSSVTNIGNSGFGAHYLRPNTSLTYIDLSNVTNIGASAFINQLALSIDVADLANVVSIGENAFNSCSNIYGELSLPKLISAEPSAFLDCSKITKIKCLGKLTSIPNNFIRKHSNNMQLSEVCIPYECTSINFNAFNNDSNLVTLKQYTLSVDNWVEGETPTYGDITRVTSFGESCFTNCSSLLLSTSAIANATTIGGSAFKNCKLLNGVLDLPNLISLGSYAFNGSGISSITNLGSMTAIPDMCFNSCDSLTTISLPNSCTSIGSGAFAYCDALQSIDLGGVTTIANLAFIGDSVLTTVTGLSSLLSIGSGAFCNCPISVVDLSNIVELGGDSFFRLNSISTSSVKLGHSCNKLARWALRSLKDPNAVLYLPLITTYLNNENLNISGFQVGLMGQSALGHFAYNNSRVTWGQIYLPNLTSAAGGWTNHPNYFGLFAGLEVDVVYIKSLSTFPTGMVGGAKIKALIIDSTTPPTLTINSGADPFYHCNEITNIYVPDGYESVYESAWSNVTTFSLTGKIKPISDLTTYNTEADWVTAGRPMGLITAYMN